MEKNVSILIRERRFEVSLSIRSWLIPPPPPPLLICSAGIGDLSFSFCFPKKRHFWIVKAFSCITSHSPVFLTEKNLAWPPFICIPFMILCWSKNKKPLTSRGPRCRARPKTVFAWCCSWIDLALAWCTMPVTFRGIASWRWQTMRHRGLTCCEEAVLFTKIEESGRYHVSVYRPEIDFILPLCFFACFTCSLHVEQKRYTCAVVSKPDCFVHSSSSKSKEAVTDRKQLFISTDSLKLAAAACTMSRTTGPIHSCLFHTH